MVAQALLLVLALALPPQLMGGCDRDVQPLQLTDVLRASGKTPPRKAGKPLPPCSRADLNSTKTVMALDSTGTDGFGSEVSRALHLTYTATAMGLPSPVCPAPSFHLQRSTVLVDAPGGRAGIHYCHAFRSADHKVQGAKAVRRAFSANPDWWSGMRCYRFDIPDWMRSWCLCTATAGGDAVAHAASATCVIGASSAVGKGRVGAPAGLFEDPRARPRMLETTRLLRRNYRRAQLGNVSSGGTLGKKEVVVAVHIRNGDAERRGTLGGAPIETTTALLEELLDLLTGAGYQARLHLHSETSSRRPDSGGELLYDSQYQSNQCWLVSVPTNAVQSSNAILRHRLRDPTPAHAQVYLTNSVLALSSRRHARPARAATMAPSSRRGAAEQARG